VRGALLALAALQLAGCGVAESGAAAPLAPTEAIAIVDRPAEPPLPAALIARYRPDDAAAAAAFDERYAVQRRCLPLADATVTPAYEACINAGPSPAWCQQVSWCATLERDVMAMFLEHHGGNPTEVGRAGPTRCQREVEAEVARQGPAVRTTLSSACAASDMIDAAIAARWAARQRR
jgi:hypothetical protein